MPAQRVSADEKCFGRELATMARTLFLRKHNRILTFLGAGLVFATFVIKENLRETWRSTADAIEAAQTTVAIRNDIKSINQSLTAMSAELYEIKHAEEIKGLKPISNGKLYINPVRLHSVLDDAAAKLEITDELREHLPYTPRFQMESKRLKGEISDVQFALGDVENQAVVNPSLRKGAYMISVPASFPLTEEDEMENSTRTLVDSIFEQARDVRETNRRRATIASTISILVFVLGWGLGLAGKLAGKETIGDD